MKNLIAFVLLPAAGCSWGLGELRGWDACAREQSNRVIVQSVSDIRAELDLPVPEESPQGVEPTEVERALNLIEERACDEIARAQVAQQDHDRTPEGTVSLDSAADVAMANAYAGQAMKINTRRKKIREFRDLILRPFADAWKVTTWVFRLAPFAGIAFMVFWIWRSFIKRDIVTVRHLQVSVPDKDMRRKIAEGSPQAALYDKLREKGRI